MNNLNYKITKPSWLISMRSCANGGGYYHYSYSAVINQEQKLTIIDMNHMSFFVEDVCILGEGTYIGVYPRTKEEQIEGYNCRFLYPVYLDWCKHNGYAYLYPRSFTKELLKTARSMSLKVSKIKKPNGSVYLKGLVIDPDYFYNNVCLAINDTAKYR